jgi:proteasome lid subunit RPN8/RPN11
VSLALAYDIGLNTQYPVAINAWREHAVRMAPDEAVAAILTDGTLVPLNNVAQDARNYFAVADAEITPLLDRLAGIIHSHTEDTVDGKVVSPTHEPSQVDMETQIAYAVPFGISIVQHGSSSTPVWWGDQLPIRPLLGRNFLHGIMDCFSLVRDWHRLQGVYFDDVPRDPDWWDKPDFDLYEDLFEQHGFERVQRVAPKVGDGFICSLRSDKRNHAGLFVSDQVFIHHPGESLSLRSQGVRWRQKIDFMVRHKDLPEDL